MAIFKITPLIGKAAATWNKGVQERLSLTSLILGNMKEIKLLGLTDRWARDLHDMRVRELDLSKKARTLSTIRLTLSAYPHF
jgi:hypothetical protein